MKIKQTILSKGFIIAGLMNLSVLVFSEGFTNSTIPEIDPEAMSNFGLLMIVVWGLAYIAAAKNYHKLKWLVAVFAIEKLVYGVVWIHWMLNNNLSDVYKKDVFAGIFYAIYGINDLLFCMFFLFVFVRLVRFNSINGYFVFQISSFTNPNVGLDMVYYK